MPVFQESRGAAPNDDAIGDEVARRENLTAEEFLATFYRTRTPVILSGGAPPWPAFEKWSLEYLAASAPDREVEVARLDGNGVTKEWLPMPLAEFIDSVSRGSDGGPGFYLTKGTIAATERGVRAPVLPELAPDVSSLGLIDEALYLDSNVWVGAGGNISSLHFDFADNFLTLVRGEKRLALFELDQTDHMYPCSIYDDFTRIMHSHVDVDRPDHERYPSFRKARCLRGVLRAGETLFLPAGCWHHVSSVGLNLAVNSWYEYPTAEKERPPLNRLERRSLMYAVRSVVGQLLALVGADDVRALGDSADRLVRLLAEAREADYRTARDALCRDPRSLAAIGYSLKWRFEQSELDRESKIRAWRALLSVLVAWLEKRVDEGDMAAVFPSPPPAAHLQDRFEWLVNVMQGEVSGAELAERTAAIHALVARRGLLANEADENFVQRAIARIGLDALKSMP